MCFQKLFNSITKILTQLSANLFKLRCEYTITRINIHVMTNASSIETKHCIHTLT